MEIKIYYEDTDCGGVVYYANYLKYFERARTEYLEARGLSVPALMKQGCLDIATMIPEMSPASITFSHVVRERQSGRVIVEGSARLAVTDGNGKVRRLDKETVVALQFNHG
jgi:acyl-CoA thioester hydrolase